MHFLYLLFQDLILLINTIDYAFLSAPFVHNFIFYILHLLLLLCLQNVTIHYFLHCLTELRLYVAYFLFVFVYHVLEDCGKLPFALVYFWVYRSLLQLIFLYHSSFRLYRFLIQFIMVYASLLVKLARFLHVRAILEDTLVVFVKMLATYWHLKVETILISLQFLFL